MVMETRQEVLERVLAMEKPRCPHCGEEMHLWEVPPINFSDGLGWGTPFLFLCFNDECSLYKQGWKDMEENFAQRASMRCFNYPGTEQFECMPVFSAMGGQGQLIDEEQTKKGFSILAECYTQKDGVTILRLLSDPCEPMRVRIKAAEMIGDIGESEAVDPLRSMRAANSKLQKAIDDAIANIHKRFFTRECPFCAEVIKQRLCHQMIRELIGMEVTDLVHTTDLKLREDNVRSVEELQHLRHHVIGYSEELTHRNRQLKDFLYTNLYRHYRVVRMAVKAERIISDLFNAYRSEPASLPRHVQDGIAEWGLERTICDYIAGMTDRFAVEEHQKLFDPLTRP